MFLIRKTTLAVVAERGSSMLAVIGLMAVAGVATLAIAGSTMNSLGVSSAARAGVQAQAAAQAGIDDALLKLTTFKCSEIAPNTSAPVWSVKIWQSTSATDNNWIAACPGSSSLRVKIVATGTAADPGIGGNTTGDSAVVEAVYAYSGPTAAIPASASTPLSFACWTGKLNSMTRTNAIPLGLQITIGPAGTAITCVVERLKGILSSLDVKKIPTLIVGTDLVVTAKKTQCTASAIQALADGLPTPGLLRGLLGASGIIDARACTSGVSLSGGANSLTLKGNVEIWAPGFSAEPGFAVLGSRSPTLTLITDYSNPPYDYLVEKMGGSGWKNSISLVVKLGFGTSTSAGEPGTPATAGGLGARISIRDLND